MTVERRAHRPRHRQTGKQTQRRDDEKAAARPPAGPLPRPSEANEDSAQRGRPGLGTAAIACCAPQHPTHSSNISDTKPKSKRRWDVGCHLSPVGPWPRHGGQTAHRSGRDDIAGPQCTHHRHQAGADHHELRRRQRRLGIQPQHRSSSTGTSSTEPPPPSSPISTPIKDRKEGWRVLA